MLNDKLVWLVIALAVCVTKAHPRKSWSMEDENDSSSSRSSSNNGHGDRNLSCGNQRRMDDTWLFGSYHTGNRPFSYTDTDGLFKGHDLGMVADVCRIANQKCRVAVIAFEVCITFLRGIWGPGTGVTSGYLDACMGQWIVPYRTQSADFSIPYRPVRKTYFYKRKGDTTFDPANINGKTIADVSTWSSRLSCLTANGVSGFTASTMQTGQAALDAVKNGNADAVISSPERLFDELELVGDGYICSSGVALLTSMGSCVPHWWNDAYSKYVACGCYKKACEKTEKAYGKPIRCFTYAKSYCSKADKQRYCP